METGFLLSPQGDLKSVISYYKKCVGSLLPDHVWFSDQMLRDSTPQLSGYPLMPSDIQGGNLLDPFISIAALHDCLDYKPQFGVAVTDFVKHRPAGLARISYTLGQLLGKKFCMGVGLGGGVNLEPLGYDMTLRCRSEFEKSLKEYVDIKKFGTYISPKNGVIDLGYSGVQGEVWLGGQHDKLLRVIAKYADGWLPAVRMTNDEYRKKIDSLFKLCADYGTDLPKLGMHTSLIMGRSKKDVFAMADDNPILKNLTFRLPADGWKKHGLIPPTEMINTGGVLLKDIPAPRLYQAFISQPAKLLESFYFVGNAEEVAEELYPFREAGLQHIALTLENDITDISDKSEIPLVEFKKLFEEIKRW